MKYFIDTNVFLRVLIKEDNKTFNDCYQFLKKIKSGKLTGLTASLVLAEVSWTLLSYYKFPQKKVIQAVRGIINLKNLKISDNYDHFLALKLWEAKKAKYIDTVIASIRQIQTKEWIIVSYDKDFDKLGVKRLEPKDF